MKFCGYCGASITDSALSFCQECGKKLVFSDEVKAGNPVKKKKCPTNQAKRRRKSPKPAPAIQEADHLDKSCNDDYDGYYEDVETEDHGGTTERMDPKLIRQILFIGLGAIALIGLSTLIINFV